MMKNLRPFAKGQKKSQFKSYCLKNILTRYVLAAASAALFFSSQSFAEAADWPNHIKQFVEVRKDRELFVDYIPPERNKPTIVLLNGLTYSTEQWDTMTRHLRRKGFGVFRYDMFGMGQTLLKYGAITAVIPYQEQVQDLAVLLKKFNLDKNTYLVGLSYGGAIALEYGRMFPQHLGALVVMAPYIAPLEQQDKWIKTQVWVARKTNPFLTETDDELYDFFLKQFIYSTYPMAEPIVLENRFKLEAIFHLVQGVRKFNVYNVKQTLPENIHMILGKNDQYIANQIHLDFWDALDPVKRASLIVIENSEHKIPEAVPLFAAQWLMEIVNGNMKLNHDARFIGYPYKGEAKSKTETLVFPVEE